MRFKLLIWMFALFLLVGTASATNLTTNLTGYYTMDNAFVSGNNVINSVNNLLYNLTNVGATCGVNGLINESCNYTTNDWLNGGATPPYYGDTFSISFWVYLYNNGAQWFASRENSAGAGWILGLDGAQKVWFLYYDPGPDISITSNDTLGINNWYHIVYVQNCTESRSYLYVNGTISNTHNHLGGCGNDNAGDLFRIGRREWPAGPGYMEGRSDEFGFWANRTLTASNVSDLYNSHLGLQYPFGGPPPGDTLNLSSPVPTNFTQFNHADMMFNVTANASINNFNCSLFINSTLNQTRTGFLNGTDIFIQFNESFQDNEWNYYINCNDGTTDKNTTINTFFIDTTNPIITVGSDNPDGSIFFRNNLTGNWTFTDNMYLHRYNISIDGVGIDNKTGLNITSYLYNLSYNISSLASGNHTLTVFLADGHTAKEIEEYGVETGWWDRYIEYTFPDRGYARITGLPDSVFDEFTTTKKKDRYEFNYEPGDIQDNYTFEIESDMFIHIIDAPDTPYKKWIIMGEHWMDFNLPNEPNEEIQIIRINDNKVNVTVSNLENKDLLQFSSIGDLNTVTVNYTFATANASVIYSPNVFDNNLQTINLTINTTSSLITGTTGWLLWNTTNTTRTKTINAENDLYNSTFVTPDIDGDNTTIQFYWLYNISTAAGYEAGNLTFNQTIFNVFMDNCTAASNVTLHMWIYDEENPTNLLTGDLEIEGQFWIFDPTVYSTFKYTYSGSNNYTLCIYPGDVTVQADMYIKYTTNYTHRHYIMNDTFNNVTQNLSLYNFNISSLSDLKITARNKFNYQYMQDVTAKLQRKYVGEGVTRTVQMDRTGDYGLLFFNIKEEDTDYRIIFFDEDENILQTTEYLKFVCIAGICEIVYLLEPYTGADAPDTLELDWGFNNATNIVWVYWNDPTGVASTVSRKLSRETLTGSLVLCDNSTTAATGNLTCDVTGYTGTFLLQVDSSASPIVDRILEWIDVHPAPLYSFVGEDESVFWMVGIIITCVGFGLFSPVGGVMALVFGFFIAFFMGLASWISMTIMIIITAFAIAIGLKLKR